MKKDTELYINQFFKKLNQGLCEELEVEMIHFHPILDDRRHRISK